MKHFLKASEAFVGRIQNVNPVIITYESLNLSL